MLREKSYLVPGALALLYGIFMLFTNYTFVLSVFSQSMLGIEPVEPEMGTVVFIFLLLFLAGFAFIMNELKRLLNNKLLMSTADDTLSLYMFVMVGIKLLNGILTLVNPYGENTLIHLLHLAALGIMPIILGVKILKLMKGRQERIYNFGLFLTASGISVLTIIGLIAYPFLDAITWFLLAGIFFGAERLQPSEESAQPSAS